MATVFWDVEGVIPMDFMAQGTTINSDAYVRTLRQLKAKLKRVRLNLEMSKGLLQHDNARSHTNIKIREDHFFWTDDRNPSPIPIRFGAM